MWIPSFVEAAKPMVATFFHEGQRTRSRELLAAIEKRRRVKSVRKALWPIREISYGFDVYNHRIDEFIRSSTYAFVESTLATASEDAGKAYAMLREQLGTSLRSGEGIRELNARIFRIFREPYRAARVAQTEASRSQNMGGMAAAIDAGITNSSRWLASSDACDKCLLLHNQVREYGKPFWINPKGGKYAIVLCPPLHPTCFCVTTDVIDESVTITPEKVERLRMLAYDPSRVRRFAV
jgi:hypothetical protein